MEKKPDQFGFNVSRILDSVFFVEEAINIGSDEDVRIGYGLALFSNVEESWVQYNVTAQFSIENKLFASGTVVTKFGIDNLKAFVDTEKNKTVWPIGSLESMFGIAFSHTRALIAKNMSGTQFSKYILPLINPSELFKQLMKDNPYFEGKEFNPEEEVKSQSLDDAYNELPSITTKEKSKRLRRSKLLNDSPKPNPD